MSTEQKVLYVPILRKKKNGEDGEAFLRLGVKITLPNGHWWFYHFRFASWTKHIPGPALRHPTGAIKYGPGGVVEHAPEKKTSFASDADLEKRFAHCPSLVSLLFAAREQAEADDAEKRAARMAA